MRGQVFQAYDHGWMGNLLRYGQFHPMQYNLTQVTAPVNQVIVPIIINSEINRPFFLQTYIFYGTKDDVVTPKVHWYKVLIFVFRDIWLYQLLQDVEWMMSQLGNLQYYHRIEGYTHKDFLWVIIRVPHY